jgi:hypothetical protein
MKKLLISSVAIILLAAGCNNNKKPGDITIKGKDGESVTINPNDLAEKANEVKAGMEELQKLKPYTLDEMKTLVPAEIMGIPQSDHDAVSFSGVSQASAKYKMNDSTSIELSIMDCAGAAGYGMYTMRLLANFEQDNDEEYTKSTEFNGGKAVENCKKKRNDCNFTFFSGNRFMVILDGNNVGIGKLKEIAGGLNIK